MSLDTTPGGSTADSYGSVSEADLYFSIGYKKTAWNLLSTPDKEALLKESTRLLDQFFEWEGSIKSDSVQSLRWPRSYVYDIDGRLVSDSIIPNQVKWATFELAYYVDESDGFDIEENVIDSIKVGPITAKFSNTVKDPSFPRIVTDLLIPLGSTTFVSSNQVKQVKLVRV